MVTYKKHISSMKTHVQFTFERITRRGDPGPRLSHIAKESNGTATSLNSVDFWRCQAVVKVNVDNDYQHDVSSSDMKTKEEWNRLHIFSEVLHPIQLHHLLWMWLCSVSAVNPTANVISTRTMCLYVFLKFTQNIATCKKRPM